LPEAALLPPPPKRKAARRPVGLLAALGLLLVAAGGGYFYFLREDAPPPLQPPAAKAPTKPLTPSETLNQIATVPGKAINKARDVVSDRRQAEQQRVDAILNGEDPPEKRALETPPPSSLTAGNNRSTPATPPARVTSTSQLAPGVTASTVAPEISESAASPAFRSWVANARINGVFQGTPPRALINGRTVRAGQILDDSLGIIFDSVEADTNTIVFRDRSGATVSRRF
jgi:hypothetical protein